MSFEEAKPKIKEAREKALYLDNSLVEIHYMIALQNTWREWNWKVAEREFKKTLELNPNFAEARMYYAHFLNIVDRHQEAGIQARKAFELEPYNVLIQGLYAMHLNFIRDYDKAIEIFENALSVDPKNDIALSNLRTAYHHKRMYEEAIETWKKFLAVRGDHAGVNALTLGYEEGGYSMALQRTAETWCWSRWWYCSRWPAGPTTPAC